jgi:hypothetical protein
MFVENNVFDKSIQTVKKEKEDIFKKYHPLNRNAKD